ncbi:MAG: polyamine aminopropyltransferase [Elusimicrobia bacterium]|nr:polyamine aminopropyltransferase [Candidatus Obscuribacterium magneticum]
MTSKRSHPQSSWLKEWFTPHESHSHHIRRYLVKKQTAFQDAIVADSYSFQRCLILDGEMQSSEYDEYIYHEALVHPAVLSHTNPQSVLIMGGGEGATVRELLKHKTIQKIVMVDIDGEVVDFCKKHLQPWHQGAFNHPKTELIIGDAKKFIETTDRRFDIIISDLPSPIEGGPAYMLYTTEFYHDLTRRLTPGGLFVMQAGSGNLLQFELHQVLHSTLRQIFKIVRPFYAHVPSFDVPWAFMIASNTTDPLSLDAKKVEALLKKRVKGNLKFYDGMTHVGLFHIHKHLRALLDKEQRVITKDRLIYFYK